MKTRSDLNPTRQNPPIRTFTSSAWSNEYHARTRMTMTQKFTLKTHPSRKLRRNLVQNSSSPTPTNPQQKTRRQQRQRERNNPQQFIHEFDASNIGIRNQLLKHAASAYLQSAVVVGGGAGGREGPGCCLVRLWRHVAGAGRVRSEERRVGKEC